MKILFVYPNVAREKMPQIGICSLAAVARQFSHNCDMYDLTVIPKGEEVSAFKSKLKMFSPDIIAVSCRSNEWSFIKQLFNFVNVKDFVKIFGGPHATVAPEEVVELADILVLGEGEETFAEILECLKNGRSVDNVSGCWVKKNNRIIKNIMRPLISNLDSLPIPYWRIFSDIHYYNCYVRHLFKGAKVVGTFEFSRGCPYSCAYCSNNYFRKLYKKNERWRREKSPERIIQEIKIFYAEYRLDCVCWIDEIFLTNVERLRRFCELYRAEVNVPFLFMERPENMTEEKISIIKQAGAKWISVGIESGNEDIRRNLLNRRHSNKTIITAFQVAQKYNIKTHAFTMIGFPGEGRNEISDTYKILRESHPKSVQTTIFYPLNKTELYNKVVSDGLFDPKSVQSVSFYKSSSLLFSKEKKKELLRCQMLLVNYDITVPRLFSRALQKESIFVFLKYIFLIRKYYRQFREVGFKYALRAIWRRILLKIYRRRYLS